MKAQPKTLLQMAGAPQHPAPLSDAIVVIIDHQLEYTEGGLPLVGVGEAVIQLHHLLRLARAQAVPVFHVVHHGRSGAALFDPDGPHTVIIPCLAPEDGEAIIIKSLPNAFAGTDLQIRAQATGRKELIVVGFATHMCISATVRAALDLGWRVTIVADATASRDLPNPLGGVIPAQSIHEGALAALADRFAIVIPNVAALIA